MPFTEVHSSNPDDFEIQDPIGFGSSATVYLGLYKPKKIKLAIKVIDMDMFERNQIEELRRETQVMFLCRHPNLLPVYCSYVLGSKLHIVTPYLAAGSCLEILKYRYTDGLEEGFIASILKQALLGLEYLHKNGHIHRDIKAGNLLVDENGGVLLADFGVSSSLNDYGERSKMRKTFVGTPCWMAPEVMEQAGYDQKADIWSFGITAIELATGQAPLAKFPPIKVLMMTLSKDPPTLDRESTKNKFSKTFKEMIDSCLSKDPSKRPTCEKLLQHPFFKQVRKVVGLNHLIQSLPPIEKRITKATAPQKTKLPTSGESWNFTPHDEKKDQNSYFETHSSEISSKNAEFSTEKTVDSSIEPSDYIQANQIFSPSSLHDPEKLKKSRFKVDSLSLNLGNSSKPPTEVKKGRFSVSERAETPVVSPINTSLVPVENIGHTPLSREESKSSRFSVSSEPENTSPVDGVNPGLLPHSFSKRGRFQVSNKNGEVSRVSDTNDAPSDTPDHSNTLMMYANQLDSITKQNQAQRQIIDDIHSALVNGITINSQQPSSIGKSLAEQIMANNKVEDVLNDTMITFQSLIQQILQENIKLKAENEQLRSDLNRFQLPSIPDISKLELAPHLQNNNN